MSKRGRKNQRPARKQIRLKRARQRQAKRSSDLPQKTVTVELPEDFCLTTNLPTSVSQVARYIANLRSHVESGEKFGLTVDFNAIRKVDAAAALMLTAEIHIWTIRRSWAKLRSQDDKWHPEIRELLDDMGLFQFLRVEMQSPRNLGEDSLMSYVQFISDERVDMSKFDNFQRAIENKMGEGERLAENVMHLLHIGLEEAVTNVRQHAYTPSEQSRRWWVSASFNHKSRDLAILCYDRGRTIPRTLTPRGNFLRSLLTNDSSLIKEALLSRTSTNEPHRGLGLPAMANIINRSECEGSLSVYSRKGMARYEKKNDDAPGVYSLVGLETPIRGTLIEWRIRIPPRRPLCKDVPARP